MAIRRTEDEETDDTREARETQEREAEAARLKKEEEREARLRELEIENAKNASALEESRRGRETVVPAGPTEAQWQELEAMPENLGKTRQQIQAEANKMAAIADARLRPLNDRATAAEERAAKAEERAARLESRRSLDKIEDRFYKDNVALEPHKADVEAFLAEFPDADKVDAKTYEKRLKLAGDYVRGKVKTLRSETRRGEFSSRHVEDDDTDDEREDFRGRVDPKGLGGNRAALALMESVAENYGNGVKRRDSIELAKKYEDDEGRGVAISSMEEKEAADAMLNRDPQVLGGKRGKRDD